jgi:2-keto-3-deoxy-L-rhamnonate aldolase RhmA
MHFRDLLNSGRPVFGPFMNTTDPAFVEITGHTGFDFVVLDPEHGTASLDQVQNLIRAADVSETYPVVRTPPANLHMIGAVQDAGAKGILVPQIKDAEEVHQVVEATRFSPKGERGVPGQVEHPKVTGTIYEAVQTIRSKGLIAGTFINSPEAARKWIDAGVQFIGYSIDILIFADAAKSILHELKNLK